MENFDSLLSTNVEVIKATPVLMSSDALTSYVTSTITQLKSFGVIFTGVKHLEESLSIPTLTNKEAIVRPEQYSFSLGKGFININSKGDTYYKNNKITTTFGKLNQDTGTIDFYDSANTVIESVKKWQSTGLKTTVVKEKEG